MRNTKPKMDIPDLRKVIFNAFYRKYITSQIHLCFQMLQSTWKFHQVSWLVYGKYYYTKKKIKNLPAPNEWSESLFCLFLYFWGKLKCLRNCNTAWKVSVFGGFLVRIFPHWDWIRRNTEYLPVFRPNAGKHGPEKLRIRTLFTQCKILAISHKYTRSRGVLITPKIESCFKFIMIFTDMEWFTCSQILF